MSQRPDFSRRNGNNVSAFHKQGANFLSQIDCRLFYIKPYVCVYKCDETAFSANANTIFPKGSTIWFTTKRTVYDVIIHSDYNMREYFCMNSRVVLIKKYRLFLFVGWLCSTIENIDASKQMKSRHQFP